MVAVVTVQTLASEAAGWFETAERVEGDSDTRYTRTKEGRPDWVHDLVWSAHGDGALLPDDWRYACILAALYAISEADDVDEYATEFADGYVDVYTSERLAWLASHASRVEYVDEATAEIGNPGMDTLARIGLGQYQEAHEVYGLVVRELKSHDEAD